MLVLPVLRCKTILSSCLLPVLFSQFRPCLPLSFSISFHFVVVRSHIIVVFFLANIYFFSIFFFAHCEYFCGSVRFFGLFLVRFIFHCCSFKRLSYWIISAWKITFDCCIFRPQTQHKYIYEMMVCRFRIVCKAIKYTTLYTITLTLRSHFRNRVHFAHSYIPISERRATEKREEK